MGAPRQKQCDVEGDNVVDINSKQTVSGLTHEKLIQEFATICNDFRKLAKEYSENRLFQAEYQLFKSKKVGFLSYNLDDKGQLLLNKSDLTNPTMLNASHAFAVFITKWQNKVNQFNKLQEKAVQSNLVSLADIAEIKASLEKDPSALYTPTYQKMYEGLKKESDEKITQLKKQKADIQYGYNKRFEDRVLVYIVTGCMSGCFGIGIPFLIGAMISHLVDKLKTRAKLKECDKAIAEAEPSKLIDKQILSSLVDCHRHNFFRLQQALKSDSMPEIPTQYAKAKTSP